MGAKEENGKEVQLRPGFSNYRLFLSIFHQPNDILQPLQPLIQVSSLLQSRKSEEDVDTIFELCSDLTTAQVLRVSCPLIQTASDGFSSKIRHSFQIIKSYTLDDCENPIQPIFIEKLEKKLNQRNTHVS